MSLRVSMTGYVSQNHWHLYPPAVSFSCRINHGRYPSMLSFFFLRKRLAVSKADYALRETSYALSTAKMINKVTHFKSTRDVAHEFPIVVMELQQPPRTTYLVTDCGPTKTNKSTSPLPSTPPTPSRGRGPMATLFVIVDADDRRSGPSPREWPQGQSRTLQS